MEGTNSHIMNEVTGSGFLSGAAAETKFAAESSFPEENVVVPAIINWEGVSGFPEMARLEIGFHPLESENPETGTPETVDSESAKAVSVNLEATNLEPVSQELVNSETAFVAADRTFLRTRG